VTPIAPTPRYSQSGERRTPAANRNTYFSERYCLKETKEEYNLISIVSAYISAIFLALFKGPIPLIFKKRVSAFIRKVWVTVLLNRTALGWSNCCSVLFTVKIALIACFRHVRYHCRSLHPHYAGNGFKTNPDLSVLKTVCYQCYTGLPKHLIKLAADSYTPILSYDIQ